jgi:hypothetical protein
MGEILKRARRGDPWYTPNCIMGSCFSIRDVSMGAGDITFSNLSEEDLKKADEIVQQVLDAEAMKVAQQLPDVPRRKHMP